MAAKLGHQARVCSRYVLQCVTNVETGNVDAVLDGDLDIFIQAFLRFLSSELGGAAK